MTGMSGTGKSSALALLAKDGFMTVDTDTDEWSRWATLPDGKFDWVWREDAIRALLVEPLDASLFVAGCKSNQGRFYRFFDHIALLSAPIEVLLERVARRSGNPYGKSSVEREEIIEYVATVEPRLRRSATLEIDATLPLSDVVHRFELLTDERSC